MKYFIHPSAFLSTTAAVLAVCMVGCVDTGNPTPAAPATSTTINSFTISGSGPAGTGGAPLDPAIDSGTFSVSWDITSSDPYRVELYVSNDTALGAPDPLGKEDVNFFGANCGSPASVYTVCSGAKVTVTCQFSSMNRIQCGPASAANAGKDITAFLTTLPKSAHLLMKACNGLMDSCKTAGVAVVFQ